MTALFEYTARSDDDHNHNRGQYVSEDGDRPSPPTTVPVSGRGHEPLHALYRRAAVQDNISEPAPDGGLGAFLNQLGGVEYVGFDVSPESVDRSVTSVNARTESTQVTAGDEVQR